MIFEDLGLLMNPGTSFELRNAYDKILTDSGYWSTAPNIRDPYHEYSALNELRMKALGVGAGARNPTVDDTAMIWHQDSVSGLMAMWSNVAPTEFRDMDGNRMKVREGHIIVFHNQFFQHRLPPSISPKEASIRWFARSKVIKL
jgi:hypothetical protein